MRWSLIRLAVIAVTLAFVTICPPNACGDGRPPGAHAIAMHGEPDLPEGFAGLPYAAPEARKGGRLTLAYLGGFDSLNPFNVKA